MTAQYQEFESLIENGRREAPLQEFLEANPYVIQTTFNAGSSYPTVFPKFSLAEEYIPDFVMIGHRSVWMWTVDLIEIEPAVLERPMFNRAGQSTGRLRDAEGQVSKWKAWMGKYEKTYFIPKALKMLKELRAWDAEPRFYELRPYHPVHVWYRIVIGRRKDFEGWGNDYRELKYRDHVEIVPWDRLLEKNSEEKRIK